MKNHHLLDPEQLRKEANRLTGLSLQACRDGDTQRAVDLLLAAKIKRLASGMYRDPWHKRIPPLSWPARSCGDAWTHFRWRVTALAGRRTAQATGKPARYLEPPGHSPGEWACSICGGAWWGTPPENRTCPGGGCLPGGAR